MAVLHVSYCFLDNEECFDVLMDSFDEVREIGDDPFRMVKILRVQNEEVPREDVQICPEFYKFEGVRAFIIEYDSK